MLQFLPEVALKQHIACLGKTGSGKTSTAKLVVEYLVSQGHRVAVLDSVKSDWWGLTSSADGKRAGLPFIILGGPRGHVPLHSSAGKAIAELVATGKLPLSIIDMADFEAGGLQRFFIDFAETLMKRVRGVLYLVMEEAHEFAPKERAGISNENMAIHLAKKLATAGRTKGIRLIVLSQRTQALHNALLGSCDTIIAHRMTAPADQDPVKKWLKANVSKEIYDQVSGSMAKLKTGSGWVCSGEADIYQQVSFPRIATYDNTATPTTSSGEHHVVTVPVDREQLRGIIGDAVKEAEENDLTKLKADKARLQEEVTKLGDQMQAAVAAKVVEKPIEVVTYRDNPEALRRAQKLGYDHGHAHGRYMGATAARELLSDVEGKANRFAEELRSLGADLAGKAENLGRAAEEASARALSQSVPSETSSPGVTHAVRSGAAVAADFRPPSTATAKTAGTQPGPIQRVLDALAFWRQSGFETPSRAQVAAVARYSAKSSGFEKALSTARTSGLIDYPPERGTVTLTAAGAAHARSMSVDEARDGLRSVLHQNELRIVNALASVRGPITREDLAPKSDYSHSSSGFEKALSRISTLRIASYPGPKLVEMTAWARQIF